MKLDKFSGTNVRISPTAKIGKNVKIGDNTVIYDNVQIGDNTIICNDCVIGEPLNDYYLNMGTYVNPATVIGANSLIRSHIIIYADNVIGDFFQTGHSVTIREKVKIGSHCSFGTMCDIQGHATFGDYCRLHSNIHIGHNSFIGNYVWIYPFTIFNNDPTPPSETCVGPTIGDYTVITTRCTLLPGVKVGKHCVIGTGSTLGKDLNDYEIAIGSPAKKICDVRNAPVINAQYDRAQYPWPLNFDRGMPWKDEGWEKWLKENE